MRRGPYIGPNGGKWADPQHTVHWEPSVHGASDQGHGHAPQAPTADPAEEAAVAAELKRAMEWHDFNRPAHWGTPEHRAQVEAKIRAERAERRSVKSRQTTENLASDYAIERLATDAAALATATATYNDRVRSGRGAKKATETLEQAKWEYRNSHGTYVRQQHDMDSLQNERAVAHGFILRPGANANAPSYTVRAVNGEGKDFLEAKYEYIRRLWEGGASAKDILAKFESGEATASINGMLAPPRPIPAAVPAAPASDTPLVQVAQARMSIAEAKAAEAEKYRLLAAQYKASQHAKGMAANPAELRSDISGQLKVAGVTGAVETYNADSQGLAEWARQQGYQVVENPWKKDGVTGTWGTATDGVHTLHWERGTTTLHGPDVDSPLRRRFEHLINERDRVVARRAGTSSVAPIRTPAPTVPAPIADAKPPEFKPVQKPEPALPKPGKYSNAGYQPGPKQAQAALLERHGLQPGGAAHAIATKHGITYAEGPAFNEFAPTFYVTGNTYANRDAIKASVRRGTNPWREGSRAWEMSPDELVAALRLMDKRVSKGMSPLSMALTTFFPASMDEVEPIQGFCPLVEPTSNQALWCQSNPKPVPCEPPSNADAWHSNPQPVMSVVEAESANGQVLGVHQDEDGDWWHPVADWLGFMLMNLGLAKGQAKYIKKLPTGKRDHPWRYYYRKPAPKAPFKPHPDYQFVTDSAGTESWRDNFTGHPDKDGIPLPHRVPLHNQIIHGIINRPGPDGAMPNTSPKVMPTAVMMMGGPGAGKSTILGRLRKRPDAVLVDADEIKTQLPEYQAATSEPSKIPLDAAFQVHYESSYIARCARDEAIKGRRNLMIDGTGRDAPSMIATAERLKSLGYRVHLLFVHVDPAEGLRRIDSRAQQTGRTVPHKVALEVYDMIPHSFDKVKRHVHSYEAWTTSAPERAKLSFDSGPQGELTHTANTRKLVSKRHGGVELTHDDLAQRVLYEPLKTASP